MRCTDIEEEVAEVGLKLKIKRNCVYNFLSASEQAAALEAICEKLSKIECDIRQAIPVAEVEVQNSAMLETKAPLLEAAATIVPENRNRNTEEHRRIHNLGGWTHSQ